MGVVDFDFLVLLFLHKSKLCFLTTIFSSQLGSNITTKIKVNINSMKCRKSAYLRKEAVDVIIEKTYLYSVRDSTGDEYLKCNQQSNLLHGIIRQACRRYYTYTLSLYSVPKKMNIEFSSLYLFTYIYGRKIEISNTFMYIYLLHRSGGMA